MISKLNDKTKLGLIIAIITVTILIFFQITEKIEYKKKVNLLKIINSIKGQDILKIQIYDHIGFDSKNVFNKEIIDPAELDYFAKCLIDTKLWEPNHPMHYQSFDIVIYLKNDKVYTFDFSLLQSGEKIVNIFSFNNGINATYQSILLYEWLDHYNLIKSL